MTVRTLLLTAAAATNEGGGLVGFACTAHRLPVGTAFNLQGTDNYDGTYLVDAASTVNKIVVAATFVAETFAGTELVIPLPQNEWAPVWLLTINVRT